MPQVLIQSNTDRACAERSLEPTLGEECCVGAFEPHVARGDGTSVLSRNV